MKTKIIVVCVCVIMCILAAGCISTDDGINSFLKANPHQIDDDIHGIVYSDAISEFLLIDDLSPKNAIVESIDVKHTGSMYMVEYNLKYNLAWNTKNPPNFIKYHFIVRGILLEDMNSFNITEIDTDLNEFDEKYDMVTYTEHPYRISYKDGIKLESEGIRSRHIICGTDGSVLKRIM